MTEPPQSYREAIKRRVTPGQVWLFIVTILVFAALAGYKHALDKVQEGRKAATQTTCAITSAVVASGRTTVEESGKQPFPPKLEGFLERYELPSRAEREKAARAAGAAYVQRVSEGVEKVVGITNGEGILNPDGSVNCARLREVARVG